MLIGSVMNPAFMRSVFSSPSLRMISLIAIVRISRFVQNGMVIRNSHSARDRGERVAMNQAVGKPTRKVMIVVSSDSFTERQKIVRCASASCSVSSKMSRVHRMPTQASVEKIHSTLPYWPGVRNE